MLIKRKLNLDRCNLLMAATSQVKKHCTCLFVVFLFVCLFGFFLGKLSNTETGEQVVKLRT